MRLTVSRYLSCPNLSFVHQRGCVWGWEDFLLPRILLSKNRVLAVYAQAPMLSISGMELFLLLSETDWQSLSEDIKNGIPELLPPNWCTLSPCGFVVDDTEPESFLSQ